MCAQPLSPQAAKSEDNWLHLLFLYWPRALCGQNLNKEKMWQGGLPWWPNITRAIVVDGGYRGPPGECKNRWAATWGLSWAEHSNSTVRVRGEGPAPPAVFSLRFLNLWLPSLRAICMHERSARASSCWMKKKRCQRKLAQVFSANWKDHYLLLSGGKEANLLEWNRILGNAFSPKPADRSPLFGTGPCCHVSSELSVLLADLQIFQDKPEIWIFT